MAPARVVVYPDPILKQRCPPADDVAEIARIAADLLETMRSHPRCVGLAAPQIRELLRIVVVDVTGHPKAKSCHGELVLVNPVVLRAEGDELGREGCLSIPDLTGNVRRATAISVEAQGVSLEVDAFEARVLQHELDHLDGVLFLDRVVSRRDLFQRKTYG